MRLRAAPGPEGWGLFHSGVFLMHVPSLTCFIVSTAVGFFAPGSDKQPGSKSGERELVLCRGKGSFQHLCLI